MQFLQARDAEQNLKLSIQNFDGKFVFCEHVDQDNTGMFIRYKTLSELRNPASRYKKFYLNKTKVKPINVELGWTNLHKNGFACYMERIPFRSTNMGLNSNNVSCWIPEGRVSFNTAITDPGFEESLKGSYPKMQTLHDKMRSIALHPRVAISRTTIGVYNIYYDRDLVGEYAVKDKVATLYPCYSYLTEFIQKVIKEPVNVWEAV